MARAERDQGIGTRNTANRIIVAPPASERLQAVDWMYGRYIPSFRGLIEDLENITPEREPQTGLDAIIVPTSRTPTHLEAATHVAQLTNARIFYLCSGDATIKGVFNHLRESAVDMSKLDIAAVQIPTNYQLPEIQLVTDTLETPGYPKERDIATKRNVGLALARMSGWKRILFLDDDVQGLQQPQLDQMLCGLAHRDRHVVGWSYGDSQDNYSSASDHSTVIHTYRSVGGDSKTFISGGSSAVRITDCTAFFPNIYNEDWLFFAAMMRHGQSAVARAGDLTQHPKNLFLEKVTTVREEFGDTFAEGLFHAMCFDRELTNPTFFDESYWKFVDYMRKNFLEKMKEELQPSRGKPLQTANQQKIDILDTAFTCHDDSWPKLLTNYVNGWHQDLDTWNSWFNNLPSFATPTDALNYLNLVRSSS